MLNEECNIKRERRNSKTIPPRKALSFSSPRNKHHSQDMSKITIPEVTALESPTLCSLPETTHSAKKKKIERTKTKPLVSSLSHSDFTVKRGKAFSLHLANSLPKSNKQKLHLRIKRNESIENIFSVMSLRTLFFKQFNKCKKEILQYVIQPGIMDKLIDYLLCTEINTLCADYCHWSSLLLNSKYQIILDTITQSSWRHLDHLFLFIETENIFFDLKIEELEVDLYTLPNQLHYFLSLMQNIVLARGRNFIMYLFQRGDAITDKFISYCQYPQFIRLIMDIILFEYELKTNYANQELWHERVLLVNRLFKSFSEEPKKYLESIILFTTYIIHYFPQNHKLLKETTSQNISVLNIILKLITLPDYSNSAMELMDQLFYVIKTMPGEFKEQFFSEIIEHSDVLKLGLSEHYYAAVSKNCFHIIFYLFKEENETRLIWNSIKEMMEIFFKYPKRNIYQRSIVDMIDFIFSSQEEKLKLYLLKEIDLFGQIIKNNSNPLYTGCFKSILEAIPEKYKDNKIKEFEKDFCKSEEIPDFWVVPEKIMAKKLTQKNPMNFDPSD